MKRFILVALFASISSTAVAEEWAKVGSDFFIDLASVRRNQLTGTAKVWGAKHLASGTEQRVEYEFFCSQQDFARLQGIQLDRTGKVEEYYDWRPLTARPKIKVKPNTAISTVYKFVCNIKGA